MMLKFLTQIIFFLGLNSILTPLYAVDTLGKLQEISNQAHSPAQRDQGRMQILTLLIECQFNEGCILQMPQKLIELQKAQPNPMYPAYIAFIRYAEQELLSQQQPCQIPAKQEIRKVYATCLQERLHSEKTMLPLNREKIDELNQRQNQCLNEKIHPMASQGNIFAQAAMVNIGEQSRNTQNLEHWYNALMNKQGTQEFDSYLKCSDLP